jgi:hypothetical protein
MNRINRMGRQTMVAMAVLAVVALTISLGGCFSSIGTIKEGMNDLKGQPISAAIAKLGLPNEEATIAGVKTYTWRTGTIYEGYQYQCRIRIMMAGDLIGFYEGTAILALAHNMPVS